jgi:hypothetical protein
MLKAVLPTVADSQTSVSTVSDLVLRGAKALRGTP